MPDTTVSAKAYKPSGDVFRLQSGGTLDVETGGKITFNSTQQPGVENATTAATSSLAGAITAINALGGLFNDLKLKLVNIGAIAST